MSNADPEEVSVAVEHEGVSVEKSFEPDDFPVPAIAFVIRSTRDVPIDVTLTDSVPDDIEAEDIGFHPKYGAEHWRNEDGRLVFEREFDAGEEYTTVYGLRARDTDSVERFLGEPELERVEALAGGEEAGAEGEDAGQVVSDVMSEGETLKLRDPNGTDGASDDDLEAAIAAADSAPEGSESAPTSPASASEATNGSEETGGAASPSTADAEVDVVGALARELQAGSVDEDDLETLRAALGVGRAEGSVDARINQLQTEVGDLRAYTAALEDFLDENGEAQTLLNDLNDSIDGLESRLSEARDTAEEANRTAQEAHERADEAGTVASEADATATEVESEVSDIGEEVSRVESEVQSLDDRFANLSEDLSEVRNKSQSNGSDLSSVRDEVDGVRRDFEALDEEIDELHGDLESVRENIPTGELDGLDERVSEVDSRVESVDEDVERVDSRVGSLDERMADIEAEIEGLAQMREQMANVFGGPAAQAAAAAESADSDDDEDGADDDE